MLLTRTAMIVTGLVLLAVACDQKEPLTSAPYYETIAEAQAAVGSSGKPIVIDFYTDR